MPVRQESWVSLLTDFGEKDWFVGSMRGVIHSLNPRVRIIDITNQIPPGAVRQAALILKCAYRFFPPGTVHLVVVDPGVGTGRSVLVVEGGGYVFVAPDNGVLSYVLPELEGKKLYRASNAALFLSDVSRTFHGRDIFAPLAARLAEGLPAEKVGPSLNQPLTFPLPSVQPLGQNKWSGEIILKDRFGNLITSLSALQAEEILGSPLPADVQIVLGAERLMLPLVASYASVKEGGLLIICGSCGYFELAVNGGNAGEQLGLKVGEHFIIEVQ